MHSLEKQNQQERMWREEGEGEEEKRDLLGTSQKSQSLMPEPTKSDR